MYKENIIIMFTDTLQLLPFCKQEYLQKQPIAKPLIYFNVT